MNIKKLKYFITVIIILLIYTNDFCFSQTKEDLEKQKSKIEQDIDYNNSLLDQTQTEKKSSINKLYIINRNIKKRNTLINNINSEIKIINKDIAITSDSIEILKSILTELQKEYAQMIVSTWKNKNTYKRLSYVFDSKNLTQAFKRIAYFKSYSVKRKEYYDKIVSMTQLLQKKQIVYETNKSTKESLVKSQKAQKVQLETDKKNQDQLVQNLSNKEKDLKKKIAQQQAQLNKLTKEIERMIAEEVKARGGSSTHLKLTPEEQLISTHFGENKGYLPWPCERGIISKKYGQQPHPVLKNIQINNPGINILTEDKSFARSIFDGEVVKITQIAQFHKVVIIRHGEYLTVYSNLENLFVTTGQKVKAKESIGTIIKDPTDGTTELHFEIWKGTDIQNPELWLAKP